MVNNNLHTYFSDYAARNSRHLLPKNTALRMYCDWARGWSRGRHRSATKSTIRDQPTQPYKVNQSSNKPPYLPPTTQTTNKPIVTSTCGTLVDAHMYPLTINRTVHAHVIVLGASTSNKNQRQPLFPGQLAKGRKVANHLVWTI